MKYNFKKKVQEYGMITLQSALPLECKFEQWSRHNGADQASTWKDPKLSNDDAL